MSTTPTNPTTIPTGLGLLARLRATRAARADRAALRKDLRAFNTHADLLELAAILQRYPDAEADVVRRELNWSAAA
jgi:hypothetical protein